MIIVGCILISYLFCFVRLVVHELGHYIVAKFNNMNPLIIEFGGDNYSYQFDNGLIVKWGFSPVVGVVRFRPAKDAKISNLQWAALDIAGFAAELLILSPILFLAYNILPLTLFFSMASVLLYGICAFIESGLYVGHDFNNFLWMIRGASRQSL